MGLLRTYRVLMAGMLLVGVFLSGCGGIDQAGEDTMAGSVTSGEETNRVGKQKQPGSGGDGVLGGDVVDGGDQEDSGAEDVVEESMVGCAQMCGMLELCHELSIDGADEEACRQGCERSREDGMLMDRDIRCVDAADSCGDLWSCMQNFWACDEPCDSFMSCEFQDEPDECRQWCGVGVGSGSVFVEQFHCMERVSSMQLCSDLVEECELDWVLW